MITRPIPSDLVDVGGFVHALRALEAPPASDALRKQILGAMPLSVTASIGSHPEDRTRLSRALLAWRVGMLAAGLAAVAAIRLESPRALPSVAPTARAAGVTARPASTAEPTSELARLLSPFPSLAYAQSAAKGKTIAYDAATGIDAARLKAGTREYIRLSANDYHDFIPDSRMRTTLERTTRRGRDAWRLVASTPVARRLDLQRQSPDMSTIVDSTWYDASTLRPLERQLKVGVMQVSEIFSATERVQTITMQVPSAWIAKQPKLRPQAPLVSRYAMTPSHPFVVSEEGLRLLLRTLPLRAGWRGSIAVAAQEGGTLRDFGVPLTVNLRVAGIDTVQLYSGRYACWRVLIELGDKSAEWSVSQETGETLITDGPNGLAYPESRTYLMYGLEETRQLPSVRRR